MMIGIRVDCEVCRRQKCPRGRSAPMVANYCDFDCPGYLQAPRVGDLWPGETHEEFGYPISGDGTREVQPMTDPAQSEVIALRAQVAELRAELVTLKGVNEVLMRERNFDPGAGNVLAGFIEHRGRIQAENDRLRAEVERLSWKLITPESLPNRGDEALRLPSETHGPLVIPAGFDARPEDRQECDRYVGAGFTHYRPINPPASTKGEDNAAR